MSKAHGLDVDIAAADAARVDPVEERRTWPVLSFIVIPGNYSGHMPLSYVNLNGRKAQLIMLSIELFGCLVIGWAGEPDGTQSGLSGVEMTVRRPTVVSREGCGNPRRHGTLREDCCLLKRRRGLEGLKIFGEIVL